MARLLRQLEGSPIDVIHHRVGPRAALGQQLNQGEALEGVDGGDDQDIQGGGHHLGPLHLPEDLETGGPVHLGGLHQGLVHIAQGGDVQHDGLTHGGGEEDQDDAPEGVSGIAHPVDVLLNQARALEDVVEDAGVVVVHPLPHHGDGHGAGDHGEIEDAAEGGEDGPAEPVDGGGDPQGEGAHRRDADDDDDKGVFQRLKEGLVLKQPGKVGEADEIAEHARVVHIGVGQAGDDADDHGNDHKAEEENQAGQQEQIAGDVFPPLEGAAHGTGGLFCQSQTLLYNWNQALKRAGSSGKEHAPLPPFAGEGRRTLYRFDD